VIWLDGVLGAVAPRDAGDGAALFETIGAFRGELRLWDRHLARLQAGLQRLGVDAALPAGLHAAAAALLQRSGDDVLRLERRLDPRDGVFRMVTRRRAATGVAPGGRAGGEVALLPAIVRRPAGPAAGLAADLKLRPRAFHDALDAEARAGGADDGIALGDDGALLETSTCNLWLRLDAVWTTPPLDGRILPGIARALLLERARSVGVPVAERRCDLADLHRADQICVSNSVHGPQPARLLGAAVAEPDSSLRRLWRLIVAD
jgi:para-aminobenzoate synthetase/4-amino-4-deoxychorismate lyase